MTLSAHFMSIQMQEGEGKGGGGAEGRFVEAVVVSEIGQTCRLSCLSVRIGSYKVCLSLPFGVFLIEQKHPKVLPRDDVTVTKNGVELKVPAITNSKKIVKIDIEMTDVLKVSGF